MVAMWHLRTDKEGRWALFRPYEWALLNYMLEMKDEVVPTGQAWRYIVETKGIKISRATIINKLTGWAKEGLLTTTDASGKGGVRKDYTMIMTPEEAQLHIANRLLKSLDNALTKVKIEQLPE